MGMKRLIKERLEGFKGHGFARRDNRLKLYGVAESFLEKYLGGRAEPPSEAGKVDDLHK